MYLCILSCVACLLQMCPYFHALVEYLIDIYFFFLLIILSLACKKGNVNYSPITSTNVNTHM